MLTAQKNEVFQMRPITEEILNGKLHFLWLVTNVSRGTYFMIFPQESWRKFYLNCALRQKKLKQPVNSSSFLYILGKENYFFSSKVGF